MLAKYLRSIAEIAGIVFLRFPPLVRLWAMLLVAVNALSIVFIDTIYGQVALAAVTIGVVVMGFIYMEHGFVRLLGIGHFLWIPMLPWMIWKLPTVDSDSWLYRWMVCLIVVNTISFVIDLADVIRYLRGEREPHYRWEADG